MTFSEITSGIDTLTRIGVEASGSTGGGFQHSWRLVRDHVRLDTVQAAREANRNRTQYFIGCSSVFVVVLLTALMSEIDLSLTANGFDEYWRLNYTLIAELTRDIAPFSVPRIQGEYLSVFAAASCEGYDKRAPLDVSFSYDTDRCSGLGDPVQCLRVICGVAVDGATVYAIDTNRERDLLIGRAWPYQALSIGEALVQEGLARQMRGVNVGDTIVLNLRLNNLLPLVHWQAINASGIPQSYPGPSVNVAVKVVGILPLTYGKVSASDDKGVFIELDTLLELVARSVPSTAFPAPFPALFASDASLELMYQSVTAVLFTCGSVRLDCYGSSSYPTTAALVMDWASAIVRRLSFTQVNSELPVLGELSQLQVFSAFLGMVFSLVTILLSVLSIFLIYSLLMASVATKTFELGVLRMIGMSRRGVVSLILAQAVSFSVPAWILGLSTAQGLWVILRGYLKNTINTDVSLLLAPIAIMVATILGLIVPIVAAILPIRKALTTNLHDALDRRRSKTTAVLVTIERSQAARVPPQLLASGLLLTMFGFSVYYFLPLALVYQNITLLFNIFLALLMGMLFGLVLLSLNVQPLVELLLSKLIFGVLRFEQKCMSRLVLKNLMAHRLRNRKTSIMYSLALGFVIFITVVVRIELDSLIYRESQRMGAPLVIKPKRGTYNEDGLQNGIMERFWLEGFLELNPMVKEYSYVTYPFHKMTSFARKTIITNVGRITTANLGLFGGSPNVFDNTDPAYTRVVLGDSELESMYTLSEQMYTAKGAYAFHIGSLHRTGLNLEDTDDPLLFQQTNLVGSDLVTTRTLMTALSFSDSLPIFVVSSLPSVTSQDGISSFSTIMSLTGGTFKSVRLLPIERILVRLNAAATTNAKIAMLVRDLKIVAPGASVTLLSEELISVQTASETLSLIFLLITAVVMIVAFFSLNTSMYTNIKEQAKEIGILRALGIDRFVIFRLYAYEAFILIFSAAILGTLIGVIVGFSMASQRSLLTGVPLSFTFPFDIFAVVFGASVVSCIFSTVAPVLQITGASIISVLR